MPLSRKVSQSQIARDLGVSQALVSLALNGLHDGINADTYKRIRKHAAKVGYRPKGMQIDGVAAGRQTRQVGFILRSPLRLYRQSNFFSHVQHGLHAALEVQGTTTAFLGSEDEIDPPKLKRLLRPGQPFSGVVLLGEVALPFLHQLRQHDRRLVAVSASFPGFCHSVVSNEQQSIDLLVDHLVTLGHRRIGWIGGEKILGRHALRLSALRTVLRLRGLPALESTWINESGSDRAEGALAARRLGRRRRKGMPTALVCCNGLMARGVINALHREGWTVPGDLTVVAIDNTRVIGEEHPTITAASASPEKMGEAAANLILGSTGLEEESFTDLVLPAQFIRGESSGPPGA